MTALSMEEEVVELDSVTIRLAPDSIYNKFEGADLIGSTIKGFKIIALADVLPKDSDEMYREFTVEKKREAQ